MNCTSYFKDESNFSKPMPWIGLYIAAASLVCAFAMLADQFNGFRHRQWWIPCRYSSLNSASLTIVAVAIKLSVDLNTPMPGLFDQAAKASTSALICISMAIFIPSLGNMGDTELITNLIALMILVTTSIVNICIQLNTSVIYGHHALQVCTLVTMVLLSMICYSTAIALSSIKDELRVGYVKKHQIAVNEIINGSSKSVTKRLEEYLMKFSIISHTGWPCYVLERTFPCTLTVCLCFAIFLVFFIESFFHRRSTDSCTGVKSDYKWSTSLILSTQVFALLVGYSTLSLKFIMWSPIHNAPLQLGKRHPRVIESYWTQMFVEIKQRPLFLYIQNKKSRKIVNQAKNSFCELCILIQKAMVVTVKSCDFLLIVRPYYWLWIFGKISNGTITNRHSHSASHLNLTELKPYVLHLKGEEELIESMLKTTFHSTNKYIEAGKREEATHLLEFLETSRSPGFTGVFQFDSNRVPPLISEEIPPNCWSLPVVTLTSLAVSLPNMDPNKVNKFLDAVREGFYFVRKIEKNLNDGIDFINPRKAADGLWKVVDNHGTHLDIKIEELAVRGNNPANILEFLVDSAKQKFLTLKTSDESDSIWPMGAVTSYSLYRICQTILLDSQSRNCPYQTTNDLFEMLSSRTRDILAACLINLEHSILTECSRSTIENMNETARHVLNLFGRTKKIMELLDGKAIPDLDRKKLAFIDEWRLSSET